VDRFPPHTGITTGPADRNSWRGAQSSQRHGRALCRPSSAAGTVELCMRPQDLRLRGWPGQSPAMTRRSWPGRGGAGQDAEENARLHSGAYSDTYAVRPAGACSVSPRAKPFDSPKPLGVALKRGVMGQFDWHRPYLRHGPPRACPGGHLGKGRCRDKWPPGAGPGAGSGAPSTTSIPHTTRLLFPRPTTYGI
jgi:hypothetical protein